MVVLGVVGLVGQDAVPAGVPGGLVDDVGEQRRLVGGADADLGRRQEVALRVADDRQQDEAPRAAAPGQAAGVVAGGVAGVQAGGVDGGGGPLADQAAQPGAAEGLALELAEPPFLRSRRSA
jgi:hypothetical protein